VTKGLKKVDKSEMTHKNPELRASSVVPANGAGSGSECRPSLYSVVEGGEGAGRKRERKKSKTDASPFSRL